MRVERVLFLIAFIVLGMYFYRTTALATFRQSTESSGFLKRIDSSLNDPLSDYKITKCFDLKHISGDILQMCTADFKGNTSGFYDPNKHLIVLKDFNEYTIVHELFHATTMYYINKGVTDFSTSETQEEMAYDLENLLRQIHKISTSELTKNLATKVTN